MLARRTGGRSQSHLIQRSRAVCLPSACGVCAMRRLIFFLLLCLAAPWVLAALDLNSATETELDALPGVGPSRAQAIIEHRAKNGPFASVEDLRNVKGIGDKTFAELKPLLTVAASTAEATAKPPSAVSASDGFPWWVVALIVIVVVIGVVVMRRRAPRPAVQAPAAAPAPAAPPARSAASPPPRPAGSTASTPSAPPARPAGTPPRPAGSPPVPPSAEPAAAASGTPPRPAGAPPKPAGSR
jgi:competence protein ComEA